MQFESIMFTLNRGQDPGSALDRIVNNSAGHRDVEEVAEEIVDSAGFDPGKLQKLLSEGAGVSTQADEVMRKALSIAKSSWSRFG